MTFPEVCRFSLAELVETSALDYGDVILAERIASLSPGFDAFSDTDRFWIAYALALCSQARVRGHVCLDLRAFCAQPWPFPVDADGDETRGLMPALAFETWFPLLEGAPMVGPHERAGRPFVLSAEGRLYFQRYALYERDLAEGLLARAANLKEIGDGRGIGTGDTDARAPSVPVDPAQRDAYQSVFPTPGTTLDWQRVAVALSLISPLAVVSGGPGTGKTYTAARMLLALSEWVRRVEGKWPRIFLLAPTGKAAERLSESMQAVIASMADHPSVEALPREAMTIHRALGYLPQTPTFFRHRRDNPLPADIVLVDECSMVDLPLMAKLEAAVPKTARLILLGDRDQLASVEVGAVFGDLYAGQHDGMGYPPSLVAAIRSMTDISLPAVEHKSSPGADARQPWMRAAMVHLTQSRRYASGSGIERLALSLKRGDADAFFDALTRHEDVTWEPAPVLDDLHKARIMRKMRDHLLRVWAPLRAEDIGARPGALRATRILCAHRRGQLGADELNRVMEAAFATRGPHEAPRGLSDNYDGRPVMIVENDYEEGVFNGDTGVMVKSSSGGYSVVFSGMATSGTGPRRIPVSRLPAFVPVFAMTVHRSQGSEFDHVDVVLPDGVSPIVTRELLYTAVTRARHSVRIFASRAVLREAVGRTIARASGLRYRIWGVDEQRGR